MFYEESYQQKKFDLIKKISDFLEEIAPTTDKKLRDLFVLEFLGGLSPYKEYYKEIKKTLGPLSWKLLVTVVENDPMFEYPAEVKG